MATHERYNETMLNKMRLVKDLLYTVEFGGPFSSVDSAAYFRTDLG